MPTTSRIFWPFAVVFLLSALALAQTPAADQIVANQNRVPAGRLENGALNVQLEIRSGTWHPEAEDGPQLFVQAFGEAGSAEQNIRDVINTIQRKQKTTYRKTPSQH